MDARFVLTGDGTWLLQVEGDKFRWGFALMDDDGQVWDGGFGWDSWQLVPDNQVPEDVRKRFEHLLKD